MDQNTNETGFVERRSNEEFRKIMDAKIKELDDKRESNLQFKLDTVEKLFRVTVETKSEALAIALNRIQSDGTACAVRCKAQVNTFYDLINGLREHDIRDEMILQTLKDAVMELEKGFEENEDRITALENWKRWDFKRSIAIAVGVIITVVQTLFFVYEKFFSTGI